MNQPTNRLFDDIAKLMTDAAGAASSVRAEVETLIRAQAERLLNDLDLVSREEFDAVKQMAAKARTENERLAARLEVLEAQLAKPVGRGTPKKPKSAKSAKSSA
jgi:BMFP domain-containing protein YqiC